MNEPIEEENIPMETKNDDDDYVYDNKGYNNEETTSFMKTDPTRSSTPYSYDKPTENHPLISSKIEKEIKSLEKVFRVEISEEDRSKFRLDGSILQYEKNLENL